MTPTQLELIAQLERRVHWLLERIEFHADSRQTLITEAASVQRDIDAIREMREDVFDRVPCWNVNEANEGQVVDLWPANLTICDKCGIDTMDDTHYWKETQPGFRVYMCPSKEDMRGGVDGHAKSGPAKFAECRTPGTGDTGTGRTESQKATGD